MVESAHFRLAFFWSLLLAAAGCVEGDGSGGPPPIVRISEVPDCIPVVGKFPSGFDLLPGDHGTAVVAQGEPANVMFVDLNGDKPTLLYRDQLDPFPTDSDGDGFDDESMTLCAEEFNHPDGDGIVPILGRPLGVSEEVLLIPLE